MDNENLEKITYFAETDHRGRKKQFGIKAVDRMKHVYVIGKTGMGKSTLLENMAAQDIRNGNGVAFIDPHGSAVETLLDYVPKERVKDVIYFAPFDIEHPISFNIMEDVGYDKRHLVASGLLSAFRKIWKDTWSARMEYILQNTLLALLEYPDSTILAVNKMLIDKEFRKKVVAHVTDPVVKSFWVDEFAKYTDRYTQEATPAIQNKVGQFVSNPLIRNLVGQPKSSFDFRKAMDEKKILLMNLSKGRMGDTNAQLIGSMLIIKLYLAAMSRAELTSSEMVGLPSFYFYVDEFQAFANETFADILSESRKYKLSLTIAHQYIEQMPEEVRDAVFGNVGTMIVFRVGAFDAEVLEKEFAPVFYGEDIVNLGFAQIYLKLMIDGLASRPFSATTLPPLEKSKDSLKEEIIAYSRGAYASSRKEVDKAIREWHEPSPPAHVMVKKETNSNFSNERRNERTAKPPQRHESTIGSREQFREHSYERGRFDRNKGVVRERTQERPVDRGGSGGRDFHERAPRREETRLGREQTRTPYVAPPREQIRVSGVESQMATPPRATPTPSRTTPPRAIPPREQIRVPSAEPQRTTPPRATSTPTSTPSRTTPPRVTPPQSIPHGHTSFKKAFVEGRVTQVKEEPKGKTISLEALETLQKSKKEGRGDTTNKNALKDALSKALAGKELGIKNKEELAVNKEKKLENITSSEEKVKPKDKIVTENTKKEEKKIQEIPEKELRDMLKIEE